jgi:hypothetical protein
MNEKTEITLTLPIMDAQIILNALGEMPAKMSMGTIARVDRQVKAAMGATIADDKTEEVQE